MYPLSHQVEVVDPGVFYGIGEEDDAFPSVPLVASFKTAENAAYVAYWLPWNAQENILDPATIDLSLQGVQFTDPVLLDLLNGDVYALHEINRTAEGIKFDNLPLLDYPLCIVERKAILIQ